MRWYERKRLTERRPVTTATERYVIGVVRAAFSKLTPRQQQWARRYICQYDRTGMLSHKEYAGLERMYEQIMVQTVNSGKV